MTERQEINLRSQLGRSFQAFNRWNRASSRVAFTNYSWTAEEDLMNKELKNLRDVLVGIYGDK